MEKASIFSFVPRFEKEKTFHHLALLPTRSTPNYIPSINPASAVSESKCQNPSPSPSHYLRTRVRVRVIA